MGQSISNGVVRVIQSSPDKKEITVDVISGPLYYKNENRKRTIPETVSHAIRSSTNILRWQNIAFPFKEHAEHNSFNGVNAQFYPVFYSLKISNWKNTTGMSAKLTITYNMYNNYYAQKLGFKEFEISPTKTTITNEVVLDRNNILCERDLEDFSGLEGTSLYHVESSVLGSSPFETEENSIEFNGSDIALILYSKYRKKCIDWATNENKMDISKVNFSMRQIYGTNVYKIYENAFNIFREYMKEKVFKHIYSIDLNSIRCSLQLYGERSPKGPDTESIIDATTATDISSDTDTNRSMTIANVESSGITKISRMRDEEEEFSACVSYTLTLDFIQVRKTSRSYYGRNMMSVGSVLPVL
jgi:hypothetical protein